MVSAKSFCCLLLTKPGRHAVDYHLQAFDLRKVAPRKQTFTASLGLFRLSPAALLL